MRRSRTLLTAFSAAAYLSLPAFAESQAAPAWEAMVSLHEILTAAYLPLARQQAAKTPDASGSISGAVLDATGAAVAGATVTITRMNTGRQISVTTNGSGNYVFPSLSQGRYSLKVAARGFQNFVETNILLATHQSLNIDTKLRIRAASETVQVEATPAGSYAAPDSSSATRTSTPLIEVPQSVEAITHTLLVEQDAHTLSDALVNVSGVTPTKPEEVVFTPVIIRGFPAEIYVDGLPTYGGNVATNDPTSLVGIDRIEVVKGPASTLYGGGVGTPLGGLINIVSERPESKASGVVAIRGGSFATLDPYADFNLPLGPMVDLRVAGEYTKDQSRIEYDPHPPFNSGSLKTAPPLVKTSMTDLLAPFVKQSEALAGIKKS